MVFVEGQGLSRADPSRAVAHRRIHVFPGSDAIKHALAKAHPGDSLLIHRGRYPEAVSVRVRQVTLKAAGDGQVVIDGRCDSRFTISVLADGDALEGLTVQGAAEGYGLFPSEVLFNRVLGGRVRGINLVNSCNAAYGIFVLESKAVTVTDSRASDFVDAGFYVGDIPEGAEVNVLQYDSTVDSDHGIVVEDSGSGTVVVRGNQVERNISDGILLIRSDYEWIVSNVVLNNGQNGIELDPESDHNLIWHNLVLLQSADLANDGGIGNCWKDNHYFTSRGVISCSDRTIQPAVEHGALQ